MTTFHEMLGTDDSMSATEVKKRYKSISTRVHPDKGGSDALMRIVTQSYNFVLKGDGNKEVFNSVTVEKGDVSKLQAKVRLLEKENRQLKEAYDRVQKENDKLKEELKDQVAEQFTQQRRHDRASHQTDDELKRLKRQIKDKEKEFAKLEAEYNSYREKREHAVAVEGEPQRRRGPKRASGLLVLLGIILVVAMLGSMPGVSEKIAALIAPKEAKEERAVTIVRPQKPVENDIIELEPLSETQPEVITLPTEFFDIHPINQAGMWGNFRYQESARPYIAVKSKKGSYVVRGCEGNFYFYLNSPNKPLRVSPNLSYRRQQENFHVYEIQYGNGSALDNWFDSNSLLINGESFANANFAQAINRHTQTCLATNR
ncbi:hypothetical protein [Thaumasiovibrio subtropicus]|uniref:hypothetical protein n=1 Tax=Thaumasiovibrio subtropicus TaxID=1891207 RepID=UPI000B354E3F|nr:hypothetical protein [Thaumasiovibrio subtropicus]